MRFQWQVLVWYLAGIRTAGLPRLAAMQLRLIALRGFVT